MNPDNYPPTIRLADIASRATRHDASLVPRRIRMLLNATGGQIMRGHTINVGVERLTVSVPSPLNLQQECAVFFGLTIEDQIYSIIGKGYVITCVRTESGTYRADLEFKVEDKKSRIALEQLFSGRSSVRVQ